MSYCYEGSITEPPIGLYELEFKYIPFLLDQCARGEVDATCLVDVEKIRKLLASRLPKNVLVLFKEPSDGISSELLEFKENCSMQDPDIPCYCFSDGKPLREAVSQYILK